MSKNLNVKKLRPIMAYEETYTKMKALSESSGIPMVKLLKLAMENLEGVMEQVIIDNYRANVSKQRES